MEPAKDEDAAKEYKALFDGFVFALERLFHKDANIELWFEHLDSLILIYTAMIPAARAGKVLPAVSISQELPTVKASEPIEEVCDEAYVSFNAGGGGIVIMTGNNYGIINICPVDL